MSEEHDTLTGVVEAIERLGKSLQKTPKDTWDKTAIIAQIFASIFLAAIGGILTYYFQYTSTRDALDATNRTIAADFLGKVAGADPEHRATYIDGLDAQIGPHYSVPIAVRFAKAFPIRDEICGGEILSKEEDEKKDEVSRRTTADLLQRLSSTPLGQYELQTISQAHISPDAGIADAYLRNRLTVEYRISEVDDFADVQIDGTSLATYKAGDESNWIDITGNLKLAQPNRLEVVVKNLKSWSGTRLQVRIGAYMYDRFVRTRNFAPPGPIFRFVVNLPVDANGQASFAGDDIVPLTKIPADKNNCPVSK
jgi:hypothetical protein